MTRLARIADDVRVRTADVAALALLALAGIVGALAAPHLPARLQVHFTVGDLPYYGVDQLATPVALTLLPVVGLGVYGLLRGLTLIDPVRDGLADVRGLYEATLVGTVATVAVTQVVLVLLHL
jgi:uncharacterized membrane protein